MSNPIDNSPRINSGIVGTSRTQGPAGNANDSKRVDGEQASARTVESERLQMIKDRVDSTPEVDMDRVEAIKQKIAEGKYPIDPERVAEKFAQFEGLLNG